jgi:predicted lipoprotein with Yx(FWY)xxD motif
VADNALGTILVDPAGKTLYVFVPDNAGASTCYDECATAWPPLLVEGAPAAGEGLAGTDLATTERTDGTTQVTFKGWPLYYFQGDQAAGDTNGQGLNDVWWVVGPDGTMIGAPAAGGSGSTVATADNALGTILVDGEGRTLYVFVPDNAGASTCYDDCATAWPPLLSEGDPQAGDGVTAGDLATADRTDGTSQVTFKGWPLYYFQGDEAAGDTNGQGLNDVWWVVGPDGTMIGAPES